MGKRKKSRSRTEGDEEGEGEGEESGVSDEQEPYSDMDFAG